MMRLIARIGDLRIAGTAGRLVGMLCMSVLFLAGPLTGGVSSAGAAEAGVVLGGSTLGQIPDFAALGTHWVRFFATWPDLEPAPGRYSPVWLAYYDQKFSELPAGTKVIIDVVHSPQWETGSSDESTPPKNPSDYASFIAAMARRWGSRVAAYEIWNEENTPLWWAGAPDPDRYTGLLKAAYRAVKEAEPKATVVLGGLAGNDYHFLEGVYAAGGKGFFDAVGVHTDTACDTASPYEFLRGADGRIIPDSFLGYREVHGVMLANGDDKPIWMTELSWRTTGAVCSEGAEAGKKPEGVSELQQQTDLFEAYHCLALDPYVQVGLWFDLKDEGGIRSGLVRSDGSLKPAYAALESYQSKGDQLKEPCGTFTGPGVGVLSPKNNTRYSGPLKIRVRASDATGVYRIELEIDGKLFDNFESHSLPKSSYAKLNWQHAKHISFGRHTLTIIAYDKYQNPTVVNITIYHRRRRRH
jgi:hypothetical protein